MHLPVVLSGQVREPLVGPSEATIGTVNAAWDLRSEGASGGTAADPAALGAVEGAERLYEARAASRPAAWRLMRALWFRGEYVDLDEAERRTTVDRGVEVAKEALASLRRTAGVPKELDDLEPDELAAAVREITDAAPVLFWSAVSWGAWGSTTGKMAAARQGVGGKIRAFSAAVILVDEGFEWAGGHRVLGRLHTEAPRIPFFTGWVDRSRAVAELEAAVELAPDFLFNRWYLADALMKHRPREQNRARELLEDLVRREPSTHHAVEDARILDLARTELAAIE